MLFFFWPRWTAFRILVPWRGMNPESSKCAYFYWTTRGSLKCSVFKDVDVCLKDALGTGRGFPHSSVGKESTCSAGDPSSIPGSGRSPGEGTGSPLQYPWASLVAQLVKDPPAMQETWVPSLGWEDPLEKGKATHLGTGRARSLWISAMTHNL